MVGGGGRRQQGRCALSQASSQGLTACKTNLKAGEWHLGARKHTGRPKIFAEAHTLLTEWKAGMERPGPRQAGWGTFQVASACPIKPGRKQRHSFKSRSHTTTSWPQTQKRTSGPGAGFLFLALSPLLHAARDGFVMAYAVSSQGWLDVINFLFDREWLFWKTLKGNHSYEGSMASVIQR